MSLPLAETAWQENLLAFTKDMVSRVEEDSPGAEWLEQRLGAAIAKTFGQLEEWSEATVIEQSNRLFQDLPSLGEREHLLSFLADHFSQNPHFRAQYGRLLYDTPPLDEKAVENRFSAAAKELDRAVRMTSERSATILHMRGMCARRQATWLMHRYGISQQSSAYTKIVQLAEEARLYFQKARALPQGQNSEYPYISELQLLRDLTRSATRRAGMGRVLLVDRKDARAWVDDALWLLDLAERRLLLRGHSHFDALRGDLYSLIGNLQAAIASYRRSLSRLQRIGSWVQSHRLSRQLAWLLIRDAMDRWSSNNESALRQLKEACSLLETLLVERVADARAVELWFRGYVLLPEYSPQQAIDYLEKLHLEDRRNIEVTFGLVCLWFVEAAKGVPTAQRQLVNFRNLTAQLAETQLVRLYPMMWLGESWGLVPDRLIPRVQHTGRWDTGGLKRLDGYVYEYRGPAQGTLRVGDGQVEVQFPPGVRHADQVPFSLNDAERRTTVSCVVQFRYDGPRAYDVRRSE